MADPILTVKLAEPVKAMGEDVSELRFRAPTGKDLIELGNPVAINVYADDPVQTVKVDWSIMGKMMSRLAGVPLTTIEALSPNVLSKAATELAPSFFPVS